MNRSKTKRDVIISSGMTYVLVGGSNHDESDEDKIRFDGFWAVDWTEGRAELNESDDPEWLERNGQEVVEYDYGIEDYLEEHGAKKIKDLGDEYTFE